MSLLDLAKGAATGAASFGARGFGLGAVLGGATKAGKKLVGGLGDLLLGSDPGADARDVLQRFGITGELGDQSASGLTTEILGSNPAEARIARSQRLSRSGLQGSGIAEDTLGDADLQKADEIRRIRMALLSQRLGALGQVAGTPREPGLLESAGPILAAFGLG